MQIFPFLCASICLLCNHPQKKIHQKGGLGGMLGKFLAGGFNGWSRMERGTVRNSKHFTRLVESWRYLQWLS